MSNQLILPNLEIRGFRAFRRLEISTLGRVNLIVGKNNVGKTSVLEALQLYANPSPRVLLDLISVRDEFDPPRDTRPNGRRTSAVPIQVLFHGRPADPDRTRLISIGPIGKPEKTLQFELTTRKHQGIRQGEPSPQDIGGNPSEDVPRLSRRIGVLPSHDLPLDNHEIFSEYEGILLPVSEEDGPITIPRVFIGSNGLDRRSAVGYWNRINLTEYHGIITDSLRLIEPRIELTSANVDSSGKLVPIIRLEGSSGPITLRSMGEGMVRLFHLALALVNSILPSTGGILLIDEIENGLHYSIHEDLWKFVFKLARDLNVQVFATTHSWDCIEAFQRAACEDVSSEGYLIRLGWRRDEVVATVYDENDLAVVARDHIEVR